MAHMPTVMDKFRIKILPYPLINSFLIGVSLVVAFGFLPQNMGGGRDLRMIVLLKNECSLSGVDNHRWWGHSNHTSC